MAKSRVKPLTSRPLDCVYVVWFALHLVIMFAVDLVPLYPASLQPTVLLNLRHWYIATYNDQFFVKPPAWFTAFAYMEAFYHVPVSLWAVGGLLRDDPLVPLHLLIWATQTAITTGVCIVDYMSWTAISTAEVNALHGLYVPYFGLATFMLGDMFFRLQARLISARPKTD